MNARGQSVREVLAPQRSRTGVFLRTWARALRKNPNMIVGLVIVIGASFLAIFSPWLMTHGDPTRVGADLMASPSATYWLGTDHMGRDVFDRTITGTRISLLVGFVVALVTNLIGMVIGLLAGYYRRADNIVMRLMDGLMAFPAILLALALIALLGSSLRNVIIAISVVETPRMVRVVRGSVLILRETAFVEAARALGAPLWRVLLIHVAPNTLAPAMIQATYVFALAVIAEANLSFLGAGTPPFIPSWGNIMGEGRTYLQIAPWVTLFPGIFLFLTVLAINLVGDGLRDALDPKLARRA